MMKYRFYFLIWLLLALLSSGGCFGNLSVAGQPERLVTEGGIIFVKSHQTAKITQVWYRNLATGRETLLYDYGGYLAEPNPALDPADNTKLILAAKNSADDYDLYFYDLTAKELNSFTHNASNKTDRHPSFDQTGTGLVFQSARNGKKNKFYYVDLRTTNEPVTYDRDGGLVPALSPDGTKIAYIKQDAADGLYKLWVYDLNNQLTPNPKPITNANNVYHPAWAADNETIAVETYVSSSGPRFIATIKPFTDELRLQQAVYSWGKNDDYRHPAWGVSGGRTLLFFTGRLLTSARYALGAVYYDEVLTKGADAKWYLVTADNAKKIAEPCWAPDLELTAAE
jgi:Tol biopolymer transport system component